MELIAYVIFYSCLSWFIARAALKLSMFFCVAIAKEDKNFENDPASGEFISRCVNIKNNITFMPSLVNNNIPFLLVSECFLIVFFALNICLKNYPGILIILITFFLVVDSIIDNITEILPDSITIILLILFLIHGLLNNFVYPRWIIWTLILCAAYSIMYFFEKGRGDMKLLGAITIGAGPVFAIITICSSFVFLLISKAIKKNIEKEIPLGPFICMGCAVAFTCSNYIERILS